MTNVPAIKADITLDKNDLVTVAVSRAETQMNLDLKNGNAALKKAEAEKRTLEGELEASKKAILKTVEAETKGRLDTFASMFDSNRVPVLSVSLCNDPKATVVSVQLKENKDSYSGVSFTKTVPLTDDQTATIGKIEKVTVEITAIKEGILTTRQRLAKLPTLERQY